MDNIEKELKLIRLQRERLALERELALRGVGAIAGAIASGVAAPVKSIGRSFVSWWKALALVIALSTFALGCVVWKQQHDTEKLNAAQTEKLNAWNAGRDAFIRQECPESRYACSTANSTDPSIAQLVCSRLDSDRAFCQLRASDEYARRTPFQY